MNTTRDAFRTGGNRSPGRNKSMRQQGCRAKQHRSARRGIALLLVMVAVSASLVITLAFVRTQTSCIRIRQNSSRRDLALQAAHTGASVALESMHSTSWPGVEVPIARTVLSDAEGTSSFEVEYFPIEETNPVVMPDDAPLYVVLRSTGRWVSAADPAEQVTRQVEVIAKLLPRVPGRTINAGDSANASDVSPNPGGYDEMQSYSVYQKTNSTSAMMMEPCGRIDGNVSFAANPRIFMEVAWSSAIRDVMLNNIGSQLGTTSGGPSILHPHPLNGQITFRLTPSAAVQADLAKLGVPWSQNLSVPTWPAIDFNSRLEYQVFAGGFKYQAETVGSSLSNITLNPSTTNPLGFFYNNGTVNLNFGCNIHGTLIATGDVVFAGRWVHVASPNWLDTSGSPVSWNSDLWPRLPAVVATNVNFRRDTVSTVTGAILCDTTVNVFGTPFEYALVAEADISGTATSWPIKQPQSIVQLQNSPSLVGINTSGNYSIWLENGSTGSWHSILGVDNVAKRLTVVGEVRHTAPTNYRIRRTRNALIDVQGPITTSRVQFNIPLPWRNTSISAGSWDDVYDEWIGTNEDRAASMLPPITFLDYLADAASWMGWPSPMSVDGLKIDPGFHVRNTSGIKYLWSGPLFTPYNGTGGDAPYAGYRWKVTSWREVL